MLACLSRLSLQPGWARLPPQLPTSSNTSSALLAQPRPAPGELAYHSNELAAEEHERLSAEVEAQRRECAALRLTLWTMREQVGWAVVGLWSWASGRLAGWLGQLFTRGRHAAAGGWVGR